MVECNVPPAQQEEMPPWVRLLLDMMGRIENRLAISVQKETYTTVTRPAIQIRRHEHQESQTSPRGK